MKISLNKELDKEVYMAFHDAVVGGADFGKKIHTDHPEITVDNHVKYIDDFYINNERKLEEVRKNTEECFADIKETLFSELNRYFENEYNDADYTCYLSIFDCNPRYLETKSFQVYYKRSQSMRKEVLAHELTHFVFFDFCYQLGIKDSKQLWELSEIFNVLFLNIPSIQTVIGAEELLFYPDLKSKLEGVKRIWEKQLGAKEFILESLEYLEKV